jgi:uncharacterized Ntn-hydrolase superfamily protein
MFGIAIATRPIAIGAKCPFLKPGMGAVLVQANGDPRFGPLGLDLLSMGYSAPKVLRELSDNDAHREWRQVAVVDQEGRTAAWTGNESEDWKGHVAMDDFVSLGNRLTSERTVAAMVAVWETTAGEDLADRLMKCLEAGRDAGGQVGGAFSSALNVVHRKSYAWIDLRVDLNDEPVRELRRLYEHYKPLIPYYDRRPNHPDMPRDDIWRQTAPKSA